MQFKLVVYCANVLTLPAAICSVTVVPTPEDKVATAVPKGPTVAPVEVAVAKTAALLAALTL